MYVYPADIPGEANGEQAWTAASTQASRGTHGRSCLIANVFDGAVNPRAIPPRPGSPATADGFADPAIATYAVDGTDQRAPTIDAAYTSIIKRSSETTTVLGYVSTHYGTVPLGDVEGFDPATVMGQIHLWFTLYPSIGGIFLDEVSSDPANNRSEYYASVARAIEGRVVVNAGAPPPTDWLLANGTAQTLVVFENTASTFSSFTMPEWTSNYPPGAFAAIAHGATSLDQVRQICEKSRRLNIGSLYVTDRTITSGNPYRGLPSPPYWQALLANC